MPKADGAKTKSEHKATEGNPGFPQRAGLRQSRSLGLLPSWAAKHKRKLLYVIGILLAVFAVLAPTIFYQPPTAELHVASKTLSLEIASTDTSRERGLGDRDSLAPNKGMLFVFDAPARQCFWMKDMRFSLDMIFLSHTKQVVAVQPDISPKTYPKNFCADNTQYVIELNAGQAQRLGIHSGQTLTF